MLHARPDFPPAHVNSGNGSDGIVSPETSLWYNLEVTTRRFPGKTAIHCHGYALSFRDLHAQAMAIAGWLQYEAGVRKGDRVLLYMQNCPQFIVAYYAILRAGAVVVPVNPMNKADEFRHYATDSAARVVVCAADAFDTGISADLLSAGQIQRVLMTRYAADLPAADAAPEPSLPAWMTAEYEAPAWAAGKVSLWSDALAAGYVPARDDAEADDMAVMPYTSGTTGAPKGCIHTHRSVMHNAIGNGIWSACGAGSVVLSVLPLFHVSGMQHGMNTPIHCGATIVMLPRWDREAAGRLISQHGVTHWMGNPTMVIDLLASANLERFNLTTLRHVGGGGAAMPQAVAERLKQQFGLSYLEGYGLSETMAATHNNPSDRPKQQCLGLPTFNTEACVIDPTTLKVLPVGEVGEIIVSGPQVFKGYWGKPDATRDAFIELEGRTYFRTGDLGTVDGDGYYFMTDRLKRMINVSGFKVWPSEVENLLYKHPAVQDACIIGTHDAYRGETVKALVVLKSTAKGTTPEEIIDWARKSMAAYKYPRVVEFVDALPRSSTGKVMWRQLQELEKSRSAVNGKS
ncbi:long-chain fatty acid--CoA ligase [Cupriavidus basilensis]|uniref:long-chain fatty acid--CoA ligase n=1 Tax=Cupriavidus basilensis TaxID=68895 RepID=UPI0023E78DB2|nr:long-chain fatty acid--CoA ligase [Cupriavidus basilensis]MDF3882920.1 long-chain fatty acid--CoA ligase [Cupriavidus basilensis]